jgi:hypothetical protein
MALSTTISMETMSCVLLTDEEYLYYRHLGVQVLSAFPRMGTFSRSLTSIAQLFRFGFRG